MPSGKELEQLPMTNTAPGMGENRGPFEKESLSSFVDEVRPSQVRQANKKEIILVKQDYFLAFYYKTASTASSEAIGVIFTAQALNSAVPEIGSYSFSVNTFVGTSLKWKLIKTRPSGT